MVALSWGSSSVVLEQLHSVHEPWSQPLHHKHKTVFYPLNMKCVGGILCICMSPLRSGLFRDEGIYLDEGKDKVKSLYHN